MKTIDVVRVQQLSELTVESRLCYLLDELEISDGSETSVPISYDKTSGMGSQFKVRTARSVSAYKKTGKEGRSSRRVDDDSALVANQLFIGTVIDA